MSPEICCCFLVLNHVLYVFGDDGKSDLKLTPPNLKLKTYLGLSIYNPFRSTLRLVLPVDSKALVSLCFALLRQFYVTQKKLGNLKIPS